MCQYVVCNIDNDLKHPHNVQSYKSYNRQQKIQINIIKKLDKAIDLHQLLRKQQKTELF
jgi:hypothetical protein